MKAYRIKPDYMDLWGNGYEDIVTQEQLEAITRGWEMRPEEVMDQLEELPGEAVELFAAYGALGREKAPVFSAKVPATDAYDTVTVYVPHHLAENAVGETLVEIGDGAYLLDEVLRCQDDAPVLRWFDGTWHAEKLEVVG